MHYKLIILFMCSMLSAQSFFNRTIGELAETGSAKSVAMGNTHFNSLSSQLVLTNPASLSQIKGISFDFNLHSNSYLERRSLIVKDSFDDYLTEADYVSNRNKFSDYSFGFMYHILNLGTVSIGYNPLTSYDYYYEEEVRGSKSLEDGEIGIKDPLIGYHIYNRNGTINVLSAGVGLEVLKTNEFSLQVGLSQHITDKTIVYETMGYDVIDSDTMNIADIAPLDTSWTVPSYNFNTVSTQVIFNEVKMNVIYESGIDTDVKIVLDTLSYLPLYWEPDTNYQIHLLDSIAPVFYKPEIFSLGVSFLPKGSYPIELTFQYSKAIYSNLSPWIQNTQKIGIGFEYRLPNSLAIRSGLTYKTNPFKALSPESTFTAGFGRNIGKLTLEIAGTYSLQTYNYPDVFKVEGDLRQDLDMVRESNLSILLSVGYLL